MTVTPSLQTLIRRAQGHILLGHPTPCWLETISNTHPPLIMSPTLTTDQDHYAPSISRTNKRTGRLRNVFVGRSDVCWKRIGGRRDAIKVTPTFHQRPLPIRVGRAVVEGEENLNDSLLLQSLILSRLAQSTQQRLSQRLVLLQ
jgi:hypothetical protein